MAAYFIGMHRYTVTINTIITAVSSVEINTTELNSKLSKVV